MNALLLINKDSGNGRVFKKLKYIQRNLKDTFDVLDIKICDTLQENKDACLGACGKYDTLIFAGGDGTFHEVINTLAEKENVPTLGVIPCGTLCDAAKNFGANKNVKRAVKIIKQGHVMDFDICKINDRYFIFEASCGVYADIPIKASRNAKKKLGHLTYYFQAIPDTLKKYAYDMTLTMPNNETIKISTPFILCMNSKYMGGFKINKESNIHDGLIDVFYTKKEVFNGLWSYFFNRKRVSHLQVSQIHIDVNPNMVWDLDGDEGPNGPVDMKVIPNRFKIYYFSKNN